MSSERIAKLERAVAAAVKVRRDRYSSTNSRLRSEHWKELGAALRALDLVCPVDECSECFERRKRAELDEAKSRASRKRSAP